MSNNNTTLQTEWDGDDGEMVLSEQPEQGGFWTDSSDSNMWWIERA